MSRVASDVQTSIPKLCPPLGLVANAMPRAIGWVNIGTAARCTIGVRASTIGLRSFGSAPPAGRSQRSRRVASDRARSGTWPRSPAETHRPDTYRAQEGGLTTAPGSVLTYNRYTLGVAATSPCRTNIQPGMVLRDRAGMGSVTEAVDASAGTSKEMTGCSSRTTDVAECLCHPPHSARRDELTVAVSQRGSNAGGFSGSCGIGAPRV